MNNKSKSKYLIFIICALLSLVITYFSSEIILSKLNIHKFNNESASIKIEMLDQSNKQSYGREMRIVSLTINGAKLNLADYANDDWVWHEEWGYILYQQGDSDFEINLNEPLRSFAIEYVEQEGSGNAILYCNNEEACKLNMYRDEWKNKTITLSYISNTSKYFLCCDIFLATFLVLYLLLNMISMILNPQPEINSVKSNLTMFDLAKGIGIIFIILGHTRELVFGSSLGSGAKVEIISAIIGLFFLYGLLPMFFIASGYGFRISNPKNTLKKQLYFLFKPYVIVAFFTLLVSLLRLLLSSAYKPEDFWWTMLPFAFANAHEGKIGSIAINSIGPVWFGLALGIAWIVLNAILNVKNKKIQNTLLVLMLIAGYVFYKFDLYFYSLAQIVSVFWFIYAGYIIREKKIFIKENKKTRVAYFVGAIVFIILAIFNGFTINIATNNWGNNYVIAMILSIISGIIILRLFLAFNQYAIGKFKLIKEIGRNTYIIFYIHAFEYLALPWGEIVSLLPDNKIIRFIIIALLRCWVIFTIYKVIGLIKIFKHKRR